MSTNPQARSMIRSVYLYVFALVGLIMAAIGGVRLLDLGLRALIFTQAEQQERVYARQPPPSPVPLRPDSPEAAGELSPQEQERLRAWLSDYEQWRKLNEGLDPVLAQRHREAASGLALILIGVPIYLYHWRLIRCETGQTPQQV